MKTVFINTWNYLNRREKKNFAIYIFLEIFISFLDIMFLAALIWIVQFYMSGEATVNHDLLPYWLLDKNSVALVAVFFVLFSIKNVAGIWINRSRYHFNSVVAMRITENKLKHFQSSEFGEFVHVDSSVHIRRIHFQPFEFCQYMLTGMQQLISQSALIVFVVLAILFFNAPLFLLLSVVLIPPVAGVFYTIKKKMSMAKKEIEFNNEKSFQYMLEALKGYVEGNIFQANQFFLKRFLLYRQKFSHFLFHSLALQAMPARLIESSAILGLLLLILIAQRFSFSNPLLLTIGAFMAAAYKVIPGIVKMINISGQMKACDYLFSGEKEPVAISNHLSSQSIQSVELKNLCFAFGKRSVFTSVNLRVEKGCFLGIMGRSGAGKTSLFNLLLGFYQPASGGIFINDLPAQAHRLKSFWSSIAYVRQQNFLIHDTICRNICLEEKLTDQERLDDAVRLSGLGNLIDGFAEGIHGIISENGRNISGGQQQRIAIARALYKDADLILLDEPFSELDEVAEKILLRHFKMLAEKGKIIMMITHNTHALDYCHKIISLDEAKTENTVDSYAGISSFGGR